MSSDTKLSPEMKALIEKRDAILLEIASLAQIELDKALSEIEDPYERLCVFAESHTAKNDHAYAVEIIAPTGERLLGWQEAPLWAERHQTFHIEDICVALGEELDDDRFSEETIYSWCEQLIEQNVGSITYDW